MHHICFIATRQGWYGLQATQGASILSENLQDASQTEADSSARWLNLHHLDQSGVIALEADGGA